MANQILHFSLNTSSDFLPKLNRIYQDDALSFLGSLPDESVDMAITSPPYWALRDYGVKGQLGLEPTFEEYLAKLCGIFDEVRRVLKKQGTCWVNLGDTYNGNKRGKTDLKVNNYLKDLSLKIHKRKGNLPDKCLLQIPSRFAIEMTNRGWILRNEIIWHKPNAMPSSVKDRFTVDYEKLFFFTKNKKYYFETQYEPHQSLEKEKKRSGFNKPVSYNSKYPKGVGATQRFFQTPRSQRYNRQGRNMRCVWHIPTKPFSKAHFATYPEKLIETPIKAGCPENGIVLDIFMGAGTTALVAMKLNRNFLGCELNPKYIEIANARLTPYFEPVKPLKKAA